MEDKKFIYKQKLKPSQRRNLWISRVIIWIIILIVLYPIFYVVKSSLAVGDAFYSEGILPKSITLSNYTKLINETDFLIWAKNSLIISGSVATAQLIMSLTSAYAFSRMRFKGRKNGLIFLLILQMFPSMMAISAIIGIAMRLNLMDQIWAIILILCSGSAYNIWLLKGYIDTIPKELDEAAMVDGANHWQIFTKIIIPLSKPMLAVIFLFCFMGIYSEYVMTSALIKDPSNYTLALGLKSFIDNQFSARWSQYSAASILASIPIVIIFMALQKYISKGLISGSVKG